MTFRGSVKAWALLLCFLPVGVAYAGIGEIGSPVVPSNLPSRTYSAGELPPEVGDEEPENAATPRANARNMLQNVPPDEAGPVFGQTKPLLVIRFNQKRVNFQPALRKAVLSTEKRSDYTAHYDLVSFYPANTTGRVDDRLTQVARYNLNVVLDEVQTLGIDPRRVNGSLQASPHVKGPEVHLFIR